MVCIFTGFDKSCLALVGTVPIVCLSICFICVLDSVDPEVQCGALMGLFFSFNHYVAFLLFFLSFSFLFFFFLQR
ncbi:hypothetical protein K440DRAFT_382522 [Wilcoxina mikolae CBS 423.85]|nr:hypothetical protein K440DRAFT_382522 [Wilcoxina mikolae CBS 423.85]